MNDDLNLLITILTVHDDMINVAINIKHGLNTFENYEYYNEPDVHKRYLELLPEHVSDYTKKILEIKEIFEVTKC